MWAAKRQESGEGVAKRARRRGEWHGAQGHGEPEDMGSQWGEWLRLRKPREG